MSRAGVLTVGRAAAMVLLLVAMAGPWAFDSHPATEESCSAPLIWMGGGHCACLVSPLQMLPLLAEWGLSGLAGIVWLFFLPLFPFLTTLLLLLAGERRGLRALYLTAWVLTLVLSALLFLRHLPVVGAVSLRLWGVWLCAAVAIAVLVGEVLAARLRTGRGPRPAAAGADWPSPAARHSPRSETPPGAAKVQPSRPPAPPQPRLEPRSSLWPIRTPWSGLLCRTLVGIWYFFQGGSLHF